jgi:hypothetical protein
MCTFIEDYLHNPSQAIINARPEVESRFGDLEYDDNYVYSQISSPEFRLYEEIALN